jgi:hypothetical protein
MVNKIKVHEIHDLSNKVVNDLLIKGLSKIDHNQEYVMNYHPDYKNFSGNLFYILENGRYKKGKGKYCVIESQCEYIGSAGWNEYDLNTALVLSRMFVDKQYRNSHSVTKYILPTLINETVDVYKNVWMTVNEYNKALYLLFERLLKGKSTKIYPPLPEPFYNFRPLGKKEIYFTEQYIMEYKK